MAQAPTPQDAGTPPPRSPLSGIAADARVRRAAPFVAGAGITLVTVLALSALLPRPPQLTQQQVDEAIASALVSVTAPPAYSQVVYQQVQPSLVLVEVKRGDPDAEEDRSGALGSGVVVTTDADILTSLHVVDGADEIHLTFADGSTSEAEIVAEQPEDDIAVLRPFQPPPNVFPATLGNPATVQPGNEAFAMGSPFGLYGSVSAGVISGLDRSFKVEATGQELTGLFQIDAAVNPGNSGGALVDRNGFVIGIVTALINPTKDDVFIGIGLAVPIDVAGGAAGLPPY